MSLSARRAWIEIFRGGTLNINGPVALRKESVDRNTSIDNITQGVFNVALRKESVDRNTRCASHRFSVPLSLSARRAWIEMKNLMLAPSISDVALRKESVDRNAETT